MGDVESEWAHMWGRVTSSYSFLSCFTIIRALTTLLSGAKIKLRNDMPDDLIRDAVETSRRILGETTDFDADGKFPFHSKYECSNHLLYYRYIYI